MSVGRQSDGIMQVASSLTPWPWESRFSKELQTLVRIPPGDRIISEGFEGRNSGRSGWHTFPWFYVFGKHGADHADGMEI